MPTFNMSPILLCIITFALTLVSLSQAQNTIKDVLDAHNAVRSAVGVGPLAWNSTVADYALNYAKQQTGGSCINLVHSMGDYGENLAGSTGELSSTEAVKLWVDEKVNYDYDSNSCATGQVCGHYTQVVWRNSVRLGCANVRCDDGGTFVICSYDPPGNYVGEKPY